MNAAQPHERRRSDRRRNDRRSTPRPQQDSWFGALADGGDPLLQPEAAASSFNGRDDASGGSDSRFLAREAQRIVSSEGTALQRVFAAYVTARAALGAALVLSPWAMSLLGARPPISLVLVCLAYASQAISLWLLRDAGQQAAAEVPALRRQQWLLTIGVDLAVFSLLHLMEPIPQLNYAALLALPVLMAGVMTKRVLALATAAFVALMLLAAAWRSVLAGGDMVVLLSQAGLAGLAAFATVLLSGELAQRLAREERAARGSLELARQQAQLNRLVIDEMADGLLVVDRRARVRAANPSARAMLGLPARELTDTFALQDDAGWAPLLAAVEQAYSIGHWPEAARELALAPAGAQRQLVQVRARFTRRGMGQPPAAPPEDFCVLFLEDVRSVQARVRQEKLAAMGRVSAGIAHEIRNPLAAIAQANALLLEDARDEASQRLARIVDDNVERLKRIVDDVLAVSPGVTTAPHAIDLGAEVARASREWAQTAGTSIEADSGAVRLQLPAQPVAVLFDADHLRRVLVNLLDNARRHGSEGPDTVRVRVEAQPAAALLSVASDGPAIAPDVERHLFEPFFSTRSRGTGLGLYICRELCERYGASIEYRPGAPGERHHNVFRVLMRLAPAAAAMT